MLRIEKPVEPKKPTANTKTKLLHIFEEDSSPLTTKELYERWPDGIVEFNWLHTQTEVYQYVNPDEEDERIYQRKLKEYEKDMEQWNKIQEILKPGTPKKNKKYNNYRIYIQDSNILPSTIFTVYGESTTEACRIFRKNFPEYKEYKIKAEELINFPT